VSLAIVTPPPPSSRDLFPVVFPSSPLPSKRDTRDFLSFPLIGLRPHSFPLPFRLFFLPSDVVPRFFFSILMRTRGRLVGILYAPLLPLATLAIFARSSPFADADVPVPCPPFFLSPRRTILRALGKPPCEPPCPSQTPLDGPGLWFRVQNQDVFSLPGSPPRPTSISFLINTFFFSLGGRFTLCEAFLSEGMRVIGTMTRIFPLFSSCAGGSCFSQDAQYDEEVFSAA